MVRGKAIQPDGLGYVTAFRFSGLKMNEPPKGLKKSRLLKHCNQEFVRRFRLLKSAFERETGHELIITETYRSPELQFEYFKKGREEKVGIWVVVDRKKIITNCDGYKKLSRHNIWPSPALDVAVDKDPGPGKHISWDIEKYKPLGPLALRYGLRWGGDWDGDGDSTDQKFIDAPHLQLAPT